MCVYLYKKLLNSSPKWLYRFVHHQQCLRLLVDLHPWQHLVLSVPFILVIFVAVLHYGSWCFVSGQLKCWFSKGFHFRAPFSSHSHSFKFYLHTIKLAICIFHLDFSPEPPDWHIHPSSRSTSGRKDARTKFITVVNCKRPQVLPITVCIWWLCCCSHQETESTSPPFSSKLRHVTLPSVTQAEVWRELEHWALPFLAVLIPTLWEASELACQTVRDTCPSHPANNHHRQIRGWSQHRPSSCQLTTGTWASLSAKPAQSKRISKQTHRFMS